MDNYEPEAILLQSNLDKVKYLKHRHKLAAEETQMKSGGIELRQAKVIKDPLY